MSSQECSLDELEAADDWSYEDSSLDEQEAADYGGYENSFDYDYGGEEGFPEKDYQDYPSSVEEGPVNPYSGRNEEEIPDYYVKYEGGYYDPDYSTYLNDVKSHLGNDFGSSEDGSGEDDYYDSEEKEDYHASGGRYHDYSSTTAPYTSLHVSSHYVSQEAVREDRNHPLNRTRDEFPQHAPEYDYRPSTYQGYDRGKRYHSHKDVLKETMVGSSSTRKQHVGNNRPSKESAGKPTSNYWPSIEYGRPSATKNQQYSTSHASQMDPSGSMGYRHEKRTLIRRGYHVEEYMSRDTVEHVEKAMAGEGGPEEDYRGRYHDYSSTGPYTSLYVSSQHVSQEAVREERNHPANGTRDEFPQQEAFRVERNHHHDYWSTGPYASLHVSSQHVSQEAVREERNHPLNGTRDGFPQHAPQYDYWPSAYQGHDRGKSYYSHKDVLKETVVGSSSTRKQDVANNRPSKEAAGRPTSNYWPSIEYGSPSATKNQQAYTSQTSQTDQSRSMGYRDEKRVVIRRGYHVEEYMSRDTVEHVEKDMAREGGYPENDYFANGHAPARRQPVYGRSTSREAAYESPVGYERGEKCNRQHRQLLEIEERVRRMNWSWDQLDTESSSRAIVTPSRNGQVIEFGRSALAKAVMADWNNPSRSVEPMNCTPAARLYRFSRLG